MPTARPGRVDLEMVLEPGLLHLLSEDAFGERAPTDIAEADKQNADRAVGHSIVFVGMPGFLAWLLGVGCHPRRIKENTRSFVGKVRRLSPDPAGRVLPNGVPIRDDKSIDSPVRSDRRGVCRIRMLEN